MALVSDRPIATIKDGLAAQDTKVFAYASDSVLNWFAWVQNRNRPKMVREPEVDHIFRTSLSQQDPDEYVDRVMAMRLVNAIRDELLGQNLTSPELVMRARTFWWHLRR